MEMADIVKFLPLALFFIVPLSGLSLFWIFKGRQLWKRKRLEDRWLQNVRELAAQNLYARYPNAGMVSNRGLNKHLQNLRKVQRDMVLEEKIAEAENQLQQYAIGLPATPTPATPTPATPTPATPTPATLTIDPVLLDALDQRITAIRNAAQAGARVDQIAVGRLNQANIDLRAAVVQAVAGGRAVNQALLDGTDQIVQSIVAAVVSGPAQLNAPTLDLLAQLAQAVRADLT